MNALDLIQFLVKNVAMAIVLVCFAPVFAIAWLCYFLCEEEEETTETSLSTKKMGIQSTPVLEVTSSVFASSTMAHFFLSNKSLLWWNWQTLRI